MFKTPAGRALAAVATAALLSFALQAGAADKIEQPEPVPMPPPIAAPADTPYPGDIQLRVDLTNTTDRVVHVHEQIPVSQGELTLLYPEWIPGEHSPTGPIQDLAGLDIRANGDRIPWVRDRVNVYAFHIDVPAGVSTLDVDFDYLSAIRPQDGRMEISSNLSDVAWNRILLYPAGHFSRDIHFTPAIVLPQGWKYATALTTDSHDGNTVHFKETTLNTLVDSPVVAGENYKRLDLSTGPDNQVFLDVFADQAKELEMTPEEIQKHKNLTVQAQKLFASHHYDHYDFLFFLSDVVGGQGLEHHQSSEDGTDPNYFTDWSSQTLDVDLLAHEYTHSWNGKFRRPNDLWTPNFNVPMRDDLLWVYEGLTEYWGNVLAARSELRSPQDTRDFFAMIAGVYESIPGRQWRPLVDTTNQPTISERRPVSWVSWQRQEDYYMEGLLIWLDVDTKIRQMSDGRKSLDDFAKEFFGVHNGSFITDQYSFDDVVAALNKVQPYDWATFLRDHVYKLHPEVPVAGFTQGGYKLVFNDTPPSWDKKGGRRARRYGKSYVTSLGFSVMPDGTLSMVEWDSPAFKAGMVPGTQLISVNGKAVSGGEDSDSNPIKEAILQAEKDSAPLSFVVKNRDEVKTVQIDYHGGLCYPHLERVEGTPDRLDNILKPVE